MLGIVRGMETTIHATQRAFAAHNRVGAATRVSGGWRERAAWGTRLALLDAKIKERAVATLSMMEEPQWAVEALAESAFSQLPERRQLEVLAALAEPAFDETRWEALADAHFGMGLPDPVAQKLMGALSRGAPVELAELAMTRGFEVATRAEQLEVLDVADALCSIGAERAWIELLTPEGDANTERERLRDLLHAPAVDTWLLEPIGPGGRAIVVVGDPQNPLASFGQAVIGGRRQQRWAGVVAPDPLVERGWVGDDALTHTFQRWLLSGREIVRFVQWIDATFLSRRPGATPPNRRFMAEAQQLLCSLMGPREGDVEVGTTYRGERIGHYESNTDADCERLLGQFLAA